MALVKQASLLLEVRKHQVWRDTAGRPATAAPGRSEAPHSVEETGLSDVAAGHAFFHGPRDSQGHSNVIGLDLILLSLREELRQSVEGWIQKETEGSLESELEGSGV
ncbi:unnamed protein product [Boreogadus saida]